MLVASKVTEVVRRWQYIFEVMYSLRTINACKKLCFWC